MFYYPSGLMGRPESVEEYKRYEIDDLVVYIDKEILSELDPNKKKGLRFLVEGYGMFMVPMEEIYPDRD